MWITPCSPSHGQKLMINWLVVEKSPYLLYENILNCSVFKWTGHEVLFSLRWASAIIMQCFLWLWSVWASNLLDSSTFDFCPFTGDFGKLRETDLCIRRQLFGRHSVIWQHYPRMGSLPHKYQVSICQLEVNEPKFSQTRVHRCGHWTVIL